MKKLPIFSIIILLGAVLALSACSGSFGGSEDEESVAEVQAAELEEADEAGVPVEVAEVQTGDISLILSYTGSLQPEDDINLIPGAAGRVEQVLVEVGDPVKTGDPIAIIEDDTYQIQIKQAEAALANAQLNLAKMELGSRPEEIAAAQAAVELARAALNDVATVSDDERTTSAANLANAEAALRRAQSEYDKIAWAGDVGSTPQAAALQQATIAYESALAAYNLGTNPSDSQLAPLMLQLAQAELQLSLRLQPFREIDFEQARVGIRQAEAVLELAENQLEETTITAPFDGIISELNITTGSMVSQQTPVASIISEELEAEIEVQESLISQVENGQFASMQITAYPGQDFPAVVTSVAPTANKDTRTFKVSITPTEGEELLRSGMFADVAILTQENKNSTLAPQEAIVQEGNQPTVFVLNDDNTVEKRNVTTGLHDNERVEILSGLKPGDLVVIAGQPNLVDGVKVEPVNDPRIAD